MKKQLLFATTLFLSAMSFGQIPTDGLEAYYPFSGNAEDKSSNKNNLKVDGAILTEDRFGNPNSAYEFDGINDKIYKDSTIYKDSSFSISFWVNPKNVIPEQNFISLYRPVGDVNQGHYVIVAIKEGDVRYTHRGNSGDIGGSTIKSNDNNLLLEDNKWYNICAVYDNVEKKQKLYINGELVESKTDLTGSNNETVFTTFGQLTTNNPARKFKGVIDDVRIYKKALSSIEINKIYFNENSCEEIVKVAVQDTLIIQTTISGINNTTVNHTTKVYPNPAKDYVNFDFTNYTDLNGYSLKIINNVSQEVYSTEITQQEESVELSSLGVKGLYFIQILNSNNELVEVRKLLIE